MCLQMYPKFFIYPETDYHIRSTYLEQCLLFFILYTDNTPAPCAMLNAAKGRK